MAISFSRITRGGFTAPLPYNQDRAVASLDNLCGYTALKKAGNSVAPFGPGDDQIRLLTAHHFQNLVRCRSHSWKLPDAVSRLFELGRFLRKQFLPGLLDDRIPQKRHDVDQKN